MRLPRLLLPAFLVSTLVPVGVHADPVQITSGFLTSSGSFGSADFQFVGADFVAVGTAEPGVVWPSLQCFPCTSGDVISMNTDYSGTIGGGSATVDGTSYERVTFGGELMFRSSPTIAPAMAGAFTVSQPFAFSGRLLGFLNYNLPTEQLAFERLLAGRGTVTASFGANPSGGAPIFSFQTVRYDFTSDAAVPEPATLLLFGTGLAAAYWRRRRG
jgi:PEP-CTERM motif-containing protein